MFPQRKGVSNAKTKIKVGEAYWVPPGIYGENSFFRLLLDKGISEKFVSMAYLREHAKSKGLLVES